MRKEFAFPLMVIAVCLPLCSYSVSRFPFFLKVSYSDKLIDAIPSVFIESHDFPFIFMLVWINCFGGGGAGGGCGIFAAVKEEVDIRFYQFVIEC